MGDFDDLSPQEQILRRVLRGDRLAPADIDGLLAARVHESIHLDFKSGLIVHDDRGRAEPGRPTKFEGKIRKFVAGFANADGGVLVVGVAEPKRRNAEGNEERDPTKPLYVDGIPTEFAADKEAIHRAVGQALAKAITPGVRPTVRIRPVVHPAGLVVVVAVPRYEHHVTTVESERLVHYFRFADNTVAAPEYLVEDLVLGRRRRPEFQVAFAAHPTVDLQRKIEFSIKVRNTGLVWMEETRLGLVAYTAGGGGAGEPLNDSIAPLVEVRPFGQRADEPRVFPLEPRGGPAGQRPELVGPFQMLSAVCPTTGFTIAGGDECWWTAALYVTQLNQPVRWFQVIVWIPLRREARGWILSPDRRLPVVSVSFGAGSAATPPREWFDSREADGQIEVWLKAPADEE